MADEWLIVCMSQEASEFITKGYSVKGLAPVVQKLDNAIQRIAWFVLLTLIRWIAIYPVDSVIQPLNNRAQENKPKYFLLSLSSRREMNTT